MVNFLFSLTNIKQLLFFFLIFLLVFLIKKRARTQQQIIINGIWFSEDGSIPEEAVNNLVQLAKKINTCKYKGVYKLFLWTDCKKLQAQPNKILSSHGIVLKDYRQVKPKGEASKKINAWLDDFIQLGNNDNKYFYCLASDLFRFYLLLKEFPENYQNTVTCYIDCNDIEILTLPSPDIFQQLDSVAFNYAYTYLLGILGNLLGHNNLSLPFFNNDVILAANKRNKDLLNAIFKAYYDHLCDINRRTGGIVAKLKETRDTIKIQDQDLALVIVIGITHTLNIFRLKEYLYDAFLLEYNEETLEVKRLDNINYSAAFIDFKRSPKNQSLTWAKDPPSKKPSTSHEKKCREFWYELYTERYHSASNVLNKKLAAANIAALL